MEGILILWLMTQSAFSISEVCSNPPDETSGEFVEFHNDSSEAVDTWGFTITDGDALDPLEPWTGSFPQSGVVLETSMVPAGGYAVLLENGYLNDPWLEFAPGTIILTTGDNSICNGLAASSDPLTLFNGSGTSSENVLSTFGTPFESNSWEQRDDDGLDSIPFDPGEGLSLFRYPLNTADSEAAWFTAAPGPGYPPDAPPDTFALMIDSLWISSEDPEPGTGISAGCRLTCTGTVPPDSGDVFLYTDSNGDSIPQCGEILISIPASSMEPGASDTLEAWFTAPPRGWYPLVCSIPGGEERLHFSTGGGVDPVITEVMANPVLEDTEEYLEIYYPGPGVFPLQGCFFTDGDAVDEVVHLENSAYLAPGTAGLIMDPEYTGTLGVPGGTPLFTPANTTLGNGLTTTDPVLLYNWNGTELSCLLSTAGTPTLNDDPLLCDDNGTDSIPFDPGNGCSMERIFPDGPDLQYNWAASEPGGTPGTVQEGTGWTDLSTDSLSLNGTLTAWFSNRGSTASSGTASLFFDLNGDLSPQPDELIHRSTLDFQPGEQHSLEVPFQPPDSGLFLLAASIQTLEDTTSSNDTKYMTFIPEIPAWPVVTEVLCNPSDEDRDEFIELYFPGPGLADMTMFTFTDGDSQDEITATDTPFATSGSYCLILDPEYQGAYDIPGGTAVFHPGNTTLGDGLSGNDPVILLLDSTWISTYGTPWNETDGIPFDPGTDLSVERIATELPDAQENWYSSPGGPTPGTGPQGLVQGVDYGVSAIHLNPPMGPGNTSVSALVSVTCLGTDSVAPGGLAVQFQGSEPVLLPVPSLGDTVTASFIWTSFETGGPVQATLLCPEDQEPDNDTASLPWNPPPAVVVNEIFYHEPEWIELYNGTGFPVDLCSLTLADPSTETTLPEFVLPPECYVVLTGSEGDFSTVWGIPPCEVLEPEEWPSLNNSGDSLTLRNNGTPVDLIPWSSHWGGSEASTLERRSTGQFGFLETNWGNCICTGTPGGANSIGESSGGDFLELSPLIFNPPSTPLQITVNLPQQACNLTVRIYNVRGMELETPFNNIVPGETLTLTWNGNGYPVGRYIVFAEAVCQGTHLSEAGVVVLARPLN